MKTLITTQRQRNLISELFFKSNIKQSQPNLVIGCDYYTDKPTLFYIGVYSFNGITGLSHVEKTTNKMNYIEMKQFLENN